MGCHAGECQSPKFAFKSLLKIADGTGNAFLACHSSDHFRRMLKITPELWREFESEARNQGELFYASSHPVKSVFSAFLKRFPEMNLCQFSCLLRPFKKNGEDGLLKAYCLEVIT